ncbi:GTP cyclohydrolase I FolE [Thiotrichales bacterium 19S3-7]|nr:GTP cyclohydrolase I FolE [Thiotrichales bacterium 19S3-7]MCF6800726.1 GTP cyclohydrolase I FolE [Thiotrichales bacterium 19S3-11]
MSFDAIKDANIELMGNLNATLDQSNADTSMKRPTKKEAEEAVKTLLSFIGEDINREGLAETPKRVVKAYQEYFAGYAQDPNVVLARTFEETSNYDDIVLLKNMRLESHCEHHMAPMIGIAHVAYLPNSRVVGISKIARVVDIFAKRLQTQEVLTEQIASVLYEQLEAKGVAVIIDAKHQCMTTRGVHKTETSTVTKSLKGVFKDDHSLKEELYRLLS